MKLVKKMKDVRINDIVIWHNLTPLYISDIGVVSAVMKKKHESYDYPIRAIRVQFNEIHEESEAYGFDIGDIEDAFPTIYVFRNVKCSIHRLKFYFGLFGATEGY